MAEYATRKLIFLAVIAFAAFVGMAFAATYTATALHPDDDAHPFRTACPSGALAQQLQFSSVSAVPLNAEGTVCLANGQDILVLDATNAWEADIDHFASRANGNPVTPGWRWGYSIIDGEHVVNTHPPFVVITPGTTLFAPLSPGIIPGVPFDVANVGELSIERMKLCAATSPAIYNGHPSIQGSIWCQHMAGTYERYIGFGYVSPSTVIDTSAFYAE